MKTGNHLVFVRDGLGFVVIPNIEIKDSAIFEILLDFVAHGKEYEPFTTKIVKDIVKPGMTCLDIGASLGYFTLQLSRQVGREGKIIAIEPTCHQFPFLVENINTNKATNVEALNIAAWDKNEKKLMPINSGTQFEADCKPLDEVLEAKGIKEVDFIKMDIDGSEPWALRGLERTIERSKNLKMIIEFYPKYLEMAGSSEKEFLSLLDKYFTYEKIAGDYGDNYWNLLCKRK